ncbi:hypothetical protein WEN_01940 [Mycoplasma wenyonii str. Massachusetts]|uniref:Uncharacterized protein n=1 Tax=Mycoplasma wenyonii (strain Massachusetts) TaxID=1197325 RepID=I6YB32_MYCWM|nr:hypothetical protein [Mycoplasma wenyonii]AFN65181.1 hypothetical protein WEN_01940 [Mycoplasma wenyonii str. Massachusetts]
MSFWVEPAQKIVKWWILQILFWIIWIPVMTTVGVAKTESLMALLPISFILWIASVVFYAFKIANFFRGADRTCGGGHTPNFLRNMKVSLIPDVLFSLIFPILIIFTRIFFWVIYRSNKQFKVTGETK